MGIAFNREKPKWELNWRSHIDYKRKERHFRIEGYIISGFAS